MFRRQLLGVAAGSALLVLTIGGTALAADPTPPAAPGQIVGLVNDVAGKTPAELGSSAAEVAAKLALVSGLEAQRASGSDIAAMATTMNLGGYFEYHQKTTSQCLAATVQSILRFKYGTVWIQPSVKSKQATINSSTGTSEAKALTYINSKLTGGFNYYTYGKNTLTTFKDAILIDVGNFTMPSYTTVDATSTQYAWHQTSPANHATTVTAYYGGSSVTSVDLDDPFTSPDTGQGCKVINGYPGYSSTPDYGCTYYSFDTLRLYNASEHQWL